MKRILVKVFLICTFKDPNLAENFTNWGKIFFKLNSAEFMEFFFSKSGFSLSIFKKKTEKKKFGV